MSRQSDKSTGSGLKLFLIFTVVVLVAISVAVLFRFVRVVLDSKFDGVNRFTIALVDSDKELYVISAEPERKKLSRLIVSNTSMENLSFDLATPIDGQVKIDSDLNKNQSIADQIGKVLFAYNETRRDITFIDVIRLYFFAKTVPPEGVDREELKFPASEVAIDALSTKLFSDNKLSIDDETIQILNASNTPGVAAQLDRVITNAGGDVVSLSTARKNTERSKISYFADEPSYTVNRLSEILGFPTEQAQERGISDIIIIIGKNGLDARVLSRVE